MSDLLVLLKSLAISIPAAVLIAIVMAFAVSRWESRRGRRCARLLPARGVQVIQTTGLPDGYIPPSGSLVPPQATALPRDLATRLQAQGWFSDGGSLAAAARAGVTAEEAGVLLSAALGLCRHANAIPVELVLTGEVVAALCPNCDRQLPANWVWEGGGRG